MPAVVSESAKPDQFTLGIEDTVPFFVLTVVECLTPGETQPPFCTIVE